jgi:hypothetical protein
MPVQKVVILVLPVLGFSEPTNEYDRDQNAEKRGETIWYSVE